MNNRIVTEPAFKIREIAREALAGRWKTMFAGILIYFVMLSGIMKLLDYFFHTIRTIVLPGGDYMNVAVGYASWIYELCVSGALIYGFSMFMLAFFRERKVDYGMIFDGFGMFGKTFLLYLLYSVKIFLWCLLFVIPGIVATYRYSQAFYIQVDHKDWNAFQCINESKRMMMGNKGKLFWLNLTFIGWYFLAAIPSAIVDFAEPTGIISIALWFITMLPVIVVDLYAAMAQTAFYELAAGNLVVLREGNEF